MGQINVAVAVNQTFEKYLYVMLASLLENNKGQDLHIFLMSADFTDSQISRLHDFIERYGQKLYPISIGADVFPEELPATQMIPVETYFRLALPDLLPEGLDRVLYLDTDLIINQPLSEFYHMDFEDKSFCACRDVSTVVIQNTQKSELFAQLRDKPDFVYFNAGVLLMNLEKLRKQVNLKYFIEQGLKLREYLRFQDQDLLNYLFYGDVRIVAAEKYNLFARTAYNSGFGYAKVKEETVIIHYAGPPKPWRHEEVRYELERFWWEYAKKTPYYTELLEEIVLKEVDTGYMDQLFRQLKQENDELKQIVQRCMELLKR